MLERLWARLQAFVLLLVYGEPLPPRAQAEPAEPPPPRPKRGDRAELQASGEFYFKDTILDQLGRYFEIMGRVKRWDPEAYESFGKIGMHVLPRETLLENPAYWTRRGTSGTARLGTDGHGRPKVVRRVEEGEREIATVPPQFLDRMPGFGAAVLCGRHWKEETDPDSADRCMPTLFYFRKIDRIDHCRPAPKGWTLYEAAAMFDLKSQKAVNAQRKGKEGPITQERTGGTASFGVIVGPAGEIEPLRRWVLQDPVQSRAGKGAKHRGKGHYFQPQGRAQSFGHFMEAWAIEADKSPEALIRILFVLTIEMALTSEASMTRVAAKKDGVTAAFGVNIERTPYFFKDRDRVPGSNRGGRIFHIVRTHERVLPSGKVRPVRTHFRGLRRFMWNGYQMVITVPGWHHRSLTDFRGGSQIIPEDEPFGKKYLPLKEFTRKVAEHLETADQRPASRRP